MVAQSMFAVQNDGCDHGGDRNGGPDCGGGHGRDRDCDHDGAHDYVPAAIPVTILQVCEVCISVNED